MVDLVELEPERPADHEAQVAAALAPLLEEAAEARSSRAARRRDRSSDTNARSGIRRATCSSSRTSISSSRAWPREQLLVVLDVVGERRAQPADGDDDDPHDGILRAIWTIPNTPERHINIHFSPEVMAGVYANFANVSHSDYEFTITFARVDHEVEDEEIPGVVVSRINLSPKFMRELIDAMQDNYSKWQTREGIKNLPEFGGGGRGARRAAEAVRRVQLRPVVLPARNADGQRRSAPPSAGAWRAAREPARRVEVGDVLQRDRALEARRTPRARRRARARTRRRGARSRARGGCRSTPMRRRDRRRRQRQRRQRGRRSRARARAPSSAAGRRAPRPARRAPRRRTPRGTSRWRTWASSCATTTRTSSRL